MRLTLAEEKSMKAQHFNCRMGSTQRIYTRQSCRLCKPLESGADVNTYGVASWNATRGPLSCGVTPLFSQSMVDALQPLKEILEGR